MSEFFSANLWSMLMVATAVGCLIPIVAIVAEHRRKIHQAELDYQLKRDLLAQGKSTDEIQAILEMTSERGPWWAKQAS